MSVVVEYIDSVCDDVVVQVEEHEECQCKCRPLTCLGHATINNDTCTCVCDEDTRKLTCPLATSFSSHTCSCECDNVDTSCVWPLLWSKVTCACFLNFNKELITYIILLFIFLVTTLQTYLNCKYFRQIKHLQVSYSNCNTAKFATFKVNAPLSILLYCSVVHI